MSLIARIYSLSRRDRITTVGLTLSGIWLFLLGLFWLLSPGEPDGTGGVSVLVTVAGIVLPIALVWLGVAQARQLAELRAEAEALRRHLGIAGTGSEAPEAMSEAIPEEPRPEARPARPVATPARPTPLQPAPLRTRPPAEPRDAARAADAEPVDAETLIRALNFPDGPEDREAIEALREALKDPSTSRVLRAAQDVVTLMAGRDVYMDDLPSETARPDVWRRFAQGERGSAVAPLGGIRQADALQTVVAMLQQDEIFRDTVHHFLRHFDGLLVRIVPELDDLQIAVLADSRSARAFMLLGRVSGVFG